MTSTPRGVDANTFKSLSRRLHRQLQKRNPDTTLTLSVLQEEMARALGHKNLHAAQASWNATSPTTEMVTALRPKAEAWPDEREGLLAFRDQRVRDIHPELGQCFDMVMRTIEESAMTADMDEQHPFRAWAKANRFLLARMASHTEANLRSTYNLLGRALAAGSPVAQVLMDLGDRVMWEDVENFMKEQLREFHLDHNLTRKDLDPILAQAVDRIAGLARGEEAAKTLFHGRKFVSHAVSGPLFQEGLSHLVARTDVSPEKKKEWTTHLFHSLYSDDLEIERLSAAKMCEQLNVIDLNDEDNTREVWRKLERFSYLDMGDEFIQVLEALRARNPEEAAKFPGDGKRQLFWMERWTGNLDMLMRASQGATTEALNHVLAVAKTQLHERSAKWLLEQGAKLDVNTLVNTFWPLMIKTVAQDKTAHRLVSILNHTSADMTNEVSWQEVLNYAPPKRDEGEARFRKMPDREPATPMAKAVDYLHHAASLQAISQWAMEQGATLSDEVQKTLLDKAERETMEHLDTTFLAWVLDHIPQASHDKNTRRQVLKSLMRIGADKAVAQKLLRPEDRLQEVIDVAQTVEDAQWLAKHVQATPNQEIVSIEVVQKWMELEHHNRDLYGAHVPRQSAGLIRWAIEHGFDPLWKNENGATLLHLAVASGPRALPIVEMLLQHGVDPMAQDNGGQLALDRARREVRGIVEALINETQQSRNTGGTRKMKNP